LTASYLYFFLLCCFFSSPLCVLLVLFCRCCYPLPCFLFSLSSFFFIIRGAMSVVPGSRVFLASWLEKKMEWRFVYERRYFTLDGTRLSYRLEEHGTEKRFGTITSFEPWRETGKVESSKGYCFTVWLLEGGSWYLRAATREIYDSWFRAILTVLVPSTNPSAAPSETGGTGGGGGAQHSRVPSSVTESHAIPSGAVPTHPHDTEGIGYSQTPAWRTAQVEVASTSGDMSSLTAAALAVATARVNGGGGRNTPVSAPDAVLLSSMVEKEKAWRGQWRPRYMELREGRLLIIRSSATSTSERQRYVIESVDPSPQTTHATWMLISTSTGDRFWVRFGSVEERQRWLTVCSQLLQTECSWHWRPLAEDDAGRAWRLRQATSGCYDNLHVHYHCATIVPSFRDELWCPSLFIFGGSDRWCKSLFNPQARAFLPHADSVYTNGRLAALELAGPHLVCPLQPAPFKEAPHALVRPLPRYGATLTCLPVVGPATLPGKCREDGVGSSSGAQPTTAASLLGARVVLLGGLTGGGYQTPSTELWNVWRSKSACMPGVELRWGRQDLPSYELPTLAFHDAVYVPWGPNAPSFHDSTSASWTQPHDGFLLVTGGLDVEYRCRSECYAVVWNYDSDSNSSASADAEERAYNARPTAYAFGQLPGPRAFHRMAVLEDGTVVLVGGRGIENAPVKPSVLTLAPQVWKHAARSWRWAPPPPHRREKHTDPAESNATAPVEPTSQRSEKWCSISSEEDTDVPASQWLRAHFDNTPLPNGSGAAAADSSTAKQWVKSLPSGMGDVAVAATGRGGRVVVMGQVTQPRQDVKLYLLDFEPMTARAKGVCAGEQFPPGTRRVRCHEVLLFVGAVPNRLVGITVHVFNGYLYVIGGCTVDKSKTDSHELCGPLRILLE
jgi:hypothetical protein